ncbi:MAG: hypothetical protein SVW57_07755 [Thermodesulfobacteriota bacterium]|nr:hypothetical protein [Thermodesulfobacteriota bacterium]
MDIKRITLDGEKTFTDVLSEKSFSPLRGEGLQSVLPIEAPQA